MIEAGANPDTLAVSSSTSRGGNSEREKRELIIGCREGIEEGSGFFTGSQTLRWYYMTSSDVARVMDDGRDGRRRCCI